MKSTIRNTLYAKHYTLCAILIALLCIIMPQTSQAAEYYVDVDSIGGQCSDNNPGTMEQPWRSALKGFSSAQPGDTVYFRGGTYRILDADGYSKSTAGIFSTEATQEQRITFRGYPGEEAIITCMRLMNDPGKWTRWNNSEIYYTQLPSGVNRPERVSSVSQDSCPLMLMSKFEENVGANELPEPDAGPGVLTGEGQWVRNVTEHQLYVWARGGGNPGNYFTEVAEFPNGDSNTIYLDSEVDSIAIDKGIPNYLTFEYLTLEGGRYPIIVCSDYIEIKNCVIRNCWCDAIKAGGYEPADFDNPGNPSDPGFFNSEYGLVENCDIYNFGESGIDITGGDYWIIRGNSIHDNVPAQPNKVMTGIMLKNNNIGTLVEKNRIFNLTNSIALTLGGISWNGINREGVDIVAKNNLIYNIQNITDPDSDLIGESFVVGFIGSQNCAFYNNLIYGCNTDRIISVLYSDPDHSYSNKDVKIKNNIFWENSSRFSYFLSHIPEGLESDYNILDVNLNSEYDNQHIVINFTDWITFEEYQVMGYEHNSITSAPTFVNPDNQDFRLVRESEGIDAGEDLRAEEGPFAVIDDFAGNLRDDVCPDIGPYEFIRVLLGDVSGNGEISAYDAALTAQATVGLITLSPEQITAADVNGDSEISAYDAALIAQKAVGLIDKFPVE